MVENSLKCQHEYLEDFLFFFFIQYFYGAKYLSLKIS